MSVDVVRRILSDYFPGRTNRLGNRRFPILPVISGVFLQDPVAGIFDLGIHRLVIIENKALSTLCFAF